MLKNYLQKFWLIRIISIWLLCWGGLQAPAQISIVTPYPAPAGNLTRGGLDTSKLQVKLIFGSTICNNINVTVNLASGVTYLPGSVQKVSSNINSAAITYTGTSQTSPVFAITGITGTGDFTFEISRFAACGNGGSFKDAISVTSSCGTVSETDLSVNKYDISLPSLTLITPVAATASVGSVLNRTTLLTNGGAGGLDTVLFYVVLPAANLQLATTLVGSLPAAGPTTYPFTPVRTNGDTLFYRLYGPLFGADTRLTNGETISLAEQDTILTCGTPTTSYGVSWGRAPAECQSVTGTSKVTVGNSAPGFVFKTRVAPAAIGCIAPEYTITDTLLLGAGSGPITYNRFSVISGGTGANIIVDTNSIAYSINGGTYTTVSAASLVNVLRQSNSVSPACLAGKVRSATYILPNEIILKAGDRLMVTYKLITSCRNTDSCTAVTNFTTYNVRHNYRLLCNATYDSVTSNNQTLGQNLSLLTPVLQTPAQVGNQEVFSVRLPVRINSFPTTIVYPARRGVVTVNVPPGVTLLSVNELQDTGRIRTEINGQTVRVYFVPNAGSKSHYLSFNFRNDAGCGPDSFRTNTRIELDSSCAVGEINFASLCYTTSPIVFKACGGGGGACPGISIGGTISRFSYGLPDTDADGKPDASGALDFSRVDQSRYIIGDTLRSISRGQVTARSGIPAFKNGYAEWVFASGIWAPAGVASVIRYRTGNQSTTCTASVIPVGSSNQIFRVKLNSLSCLADTSLLAGDSFAVTAYFRLNDLTTISGNAISAANGTAYKFDQQKEIRLRHKLFAMDGTPSATAAATTNSTGTNGYLCDSLLSNTYVAGWRHTVASSGVTFTGCASGTQTIVAASNTPYGQYFTAEYRPVALPDSFQVIIPKGWRYDGVATNNGMMTYQVRQGVTNNTVRWTVAPQVSINANNDTVLTFNYYALRQNGMIPFVGTESSSFNTSFMLKPGGCTTATAYDTVIEYGTLANPFQTNIATYQLRTTTMLKYDAGNRATLTVTNNTGDINASTAANFWDVTVGATNAGASNVWLATEAAAGSVTVDSVGLLNSSSVRTGALLTPSGYGSGNKWYQLTPSIAVNSSQRARIYFRYGNCNRDSLKVYAGNDCAGYPSSPVTVACPASISAPIYPRVLSRPSEIQSSVLRQPGKGSSITLCARDTAIFAVSSAAGAAIVNPRVRLVIPNGIQVVTPIPVEFPRNSGNWQSLNPTMITSNIYELDLTKHTGIKDTGIRGTIDRPTANARQAQILIPFTTDCRYRSGNNLTLLSYANRICGDTATGNGVVSRTSPLEITGVPSGGGTINMAMNIPTTTLSCSGRTTMALTSTPLGSPIQAGDTIVYTLPAGVVYGGNFVPGTNCAGCSVVTNPGLQIGTTEVKVQLAPGIAANTPMQYAFDLIGDGGVATGSCGNSPVLAEAVRTYPGVLSCDGVTYCSNSTRVTGTAASGNINRVKPNLNPTVFEYLATTAGGQKQYRVQYLNNGTQNAAGGIYKAEILLSSNPNVAIATSVLQKPVAINATVLDTLTFTIPSNASPSDLVTVRIAPDLKNGSNQCLCSEQLRTYSVPLPVTLLSFRATWQSNQTTLLQWQLAQAEAVNAFVVERSLDGRDFNAIAKTAAMPAQTSYQTTDETLPPVSILYYRLKTIATTGEEKYSPVETVYPMTASKDELNLMPNPAKNQVSLLWNSTQTGTAHIQIVGAVGTVVLEKTISVVTVGKQDLLIPEIGTLPAGTYLVRLTVPGAAVRMARLQILP
ncbi:MAG: hypothetical protein EOP52_07435 [Sphingobacteriales bacterium]|nr:MAG: hypothetical protein EOP52_07435 [Sphingobacteriales bacterium]